MPAEHTTCPLCKVDVSRSGFNKHFFSVKHIEEYVKPALLKMDRHTRSVLQKGTTKSSLPSIYCSNGKAIVPCFGCKKAKSYQESYHLHSECKQAEKHLSTLKELLTEPEKPAEAVEVIDAEEVAVLKKRIARLERELKEAEKHRNSEQEDNEGCNALFCKITGGKDYLSINIGAGNRGITELEYLERLGVKCASPDDD
jgi:hypothetical protein